MSSSRSDNDTLPARPSDHVDSTERGSGDDGFRRLERLGLRPGSLVRWPATASGGARTT